MALHRADLGSIQLNRLLVILELALGVAQVLLEGLNVGLDVEFALVTGRWLDVVGNKRRRLVAD